MRCPIERIDLGDLYTFEANGREYKASVTLKIYADDIPFDGDDAEDLAAFERGEFQMYVACVSAWFAGEIEGTDSLGGISARNLEDVTTCVEEHDMIANALRDLADKVERLATKLAAGVSP